MEGETKKYEFVARIRSDRITIPAAILELLKRRGLLGKKFIVTIEVLEDSRKC